MCKRFLSANLRRIIDVTQVVGSNPGAPAIAEAIRVPLHYPQVAEILLAKDKLVKTFICGGNRLVHPKDFLLNLNESFELQTEACFGSREQLCCLEPMIQSNKAVHKW